MWGVGDVQRLLLFVARNLMATVCPGPRSVSACGAALLLTAACGPRAPIPPRAGCWVGGLPPRLRTPVRWAAELPRATSSSCSLRATAGAHVRSLADDGVQVAREQVRSRAAAEPCGSDPAKASHCSTPANFLASANAVMASAQAASRASAPTAAC